MNIHAPINRDAVPVVYPEYFEDAPHERLAELRRQYAVVSLADREYLVLRADDVMNILADERVMAVPGDTFASVQNIPEGAVSRLLHDTLLLDNDQSHRTKRGLFARTFAHRTIQAQRQTVRDVADRIVADLPRGEEFDFVERMAARLPAEMIAGILGLPASEAPHFTRLVYSVARIFTPVYPIGDHDIIESDTSEFYRYIATHLVQRLNAPQDDLLSDVVTEWKATKPLSLESLIHQVMILVLAGSDTTRAAFAVLVALLSQHEDQWDAAQADPSLIPGAILEALRYEPSVGSSPRFTKEPITIGNAEIPAGTILGMQYMSAMRDPALYDEPDRFDITRTDHPRLHLVFGNGPHRCIGEMLARVETEEGLAALLAAVPRMDVLEMPRLIGIGGIRQITSMPVRIP